MIVQNHLNDNISFVLAFVVMSLPSRPRAGLECVERGGFRVDTCTVKVDGSEKSTSEGGSFDSKYDSLQSFLGAIVLLMLVMFCISVMTLVDDDS